jgi:hypothetical protein
MPESAVVTFLPWKYVGSLLLHYTGEVISLRSEATMHYIEHGESSYDMDPSFSLLDMMTRGFRTRGGTPSSCYW